MFASQRSVVSFSSLTVSTSTEEGAAGASEGLGLLELETTLHKEKRLRNVRGVLLPGGEAFSGYEIHMGISHGAALERPAAMVEGMPDGAVAADGAILATYVHGIFDTPQAGRALLRWAGLESARAVDLASLREASLERLADAVEAHLEWKAVLACLGA